MLRIILLAFSYIILGTIATFGQSLVSYTVARNTGISYSSINLTGNAFDSWRNTVSFTQDDNRSDFTDIGFDFWYNGIRYTQFSVSTNGFLDFSNSTADGGASGGAFSFNNTVFSSAAAGTRTYPSLALFYDDLTAQGGVSALGNSIKYFLSGSAPNRVLTIEWINMAVYGNTTPSLNFQAKLYERTGVIEFIYGTMTQGTQVFSYTSGLNTQVVSNTNTNLKLLQVANSTTFSNTQQHNLTTLPANNSKYVFTPPAPTATAGSLSFTGVTQTGMTINWPNWATNEVGYVLYNSTDNINFNFVTQTAANAVNYAATGLLPSTTYYWRVYAVTEGCLSASLNGSRTTLAGGNKISITTGLWNTPATWSPIGVPTSADNVTIANGHTVTVNVNALCNNLNVGQGSSGVLSIGNNNTALNISINGTVTINSGATFSVNPASNTTHSITIPGNIVNNGRLNFASDANSLCNATFTKNGNQTISGSGLTTSFNIIALSMGSSINNILDVQTPSFVAPNNFLVLNSGTFKLSTTGASNITPYTVAATIPQKGGIWLNSPVSTINTQATLTMYGNLTLSNGVFNVGDAANEDLLSNGGFLTISGGTLNIASRYYAVGINNLSKFTISGGNAIVPTIGSTNTTIAPFQITGAGSQFNMSGGSLIIPREGGTGAQNLGFVNIGTSGGSVTGGTLQIGSAASPAAQIIQINSTFPVGNLVVNSANANASLLTNTLSVINNVRINSGTFTANNLSMSLGGNWQNNGGLFVPGTGTVSLIGSSAQTIFKTGGETFNTVSFSNAGIKSLLSNITATNVVINSGSLSPGTFTINVLGNWINNGGTFSAGLAPVVFNGTTAQTIFKSAGETFNDIVFSNTSTKTLLSAITASNVTINSGTFSASTFSVNVNNNWINNGGTFNGGTGIVQFQSNSAQTIFKLGGETFNNISFLNTGSKTLLSAITASNVLINTNSNLDVNTTNNQITVRGNFTNSGTFNARNGLVFLNGTTTQSIGGTSTTDFYNLTLNNNAGANITHAENLINTLTLNNGTFNTNSQVFTMVSTATNTARIAQITGTGNIIGNVTVQRFAPGGYTGWALLGTPISSALTFQDWDDDMPISCMGCPDGYAGSVSIYTYDETISGAYDASASYIPMTSITNPITPNKGYWVYLGTGATSTSPITIDVTGAVRKFNNAIPLSKTNTGSVADDGWNLIHNPFPSPIRWSLLRNSNPNVDNAIYMYNADLNGGTGGNASYVNGVSSPAVGAGGIGDTIPMCQGFQVHCTAATTLTAQESNKVGGNPMFLKLNQTSLTANSQQLLRLKLNGPSNFNDETVLYIQPGATDNFDHEYDAIKLAGQDPYAPSICLKNGVDEFQINGISPINSTFSMPVKAITGYNGTYTISLANFNSFPTGACISLYDTFNGVTTDLKTSNYVFTLNSSTTNARFVLNITLNPLDITTNTSQPSCVTPNIGEITAIGNNAGPWNYYWKDASGTILKTSLNKASADTISNLTGGNYLLEINTVGQCDNRDSVFTIVPVETVSAQFTSLDTTYLSNGASVTFNNNSINAVNSSWDFGDGFGFSSSFNPTYNYSSAGIYTVSLIATSNSGCLDTAYKSVVVIIDVTGISSQNAVGHLIVKTLDENEFLLEGIQTKESNLNFKLYDALGKLITDFGNYNSEEIHLSVNLKEQKAGVYYLNIIGTKDSKTIKLMVK
jgi:hypothetical protein